MGAITSFLTRKIASSPTQSDPFITIESSKPLLVEGMAAGKPREAANETWISNDEMRRFSNALDDAQEFLNKSGIILARQRKMESELETCHERLRRFTGDHVRQSESNVENISSTNTPTSLEMKYKQFYAHERMDAVDHIEKLRSKTERDKVINKDEIWDDYVACIIFEESYSSAQALKRNFLQGISLIVTSAPAIGAQYSEEKKKKIGEFQFSIKPDSRQLSYKLDQGIENSLKVIMKETAEMCDVNAMVQRTENSLKKSQERGLFQDLYKKEFFLKPEIKKYTEKCCKFAWKIVCQTIPYKLEGNLSLKSSAVFDSVTHQVCRDGTSSEHASGFIKCVVWPGLFDGSSGRIIRKTEVLLQDA